MGGGRRDIENQVVRDMLNRRHSCDFALVNKYPHPQIPLTLSLPLVCCNVESNSQGEVCVELTVREWQVCSTICANKLPLSFSELKQASNLHQEVLSRILRRLTLHHIIHKVEDGRYQRLARDDQCSQ